MNYMRTAVLLAGLTALFMGVGYLVGGQAGMLLALVAAAGMNVFSYWNSDRMVLSMHGAQEVDESVAPDLYRMVAELSARAGLPMPEALFDGQSAAERLRHRAQPAARRRRGHHGAAQFAVAPGGWPAWWRTNWRM